MNYNKIANKVIDGKGATVKGPVVFSNCQDIVYKNWKILHGNNNLYLENCSRCVIENVECQIATGPADPFGHGIQLNNCKSCIVKNNRIIKGNNSEDGCNDYKGNNNKWIRNTIIGHGKSKSGNSITIDFNTKNAEINENMCDPQGGWGAIVIADGSGHTIANNRIMNCGTGITIRNCYDSKTSDVIAKNNTIIKYSDNKYWVDKKSTINITIK